LVSKDEETDDVSSLISNGNYLDRKNKELLDLIEIIELDELISKFKPGATNNKITNSNQQQNSKIKNSILTAILNNFENTNKKKKFLKTNFFHSIWG
jgi:hypothetical protein